MKKKRILLVDDEEGFTRLLKLNLEQIGPYEVRVENWPDRALRAAHEFRPDLILMDIVMPHLPGTDLAASMQTDSELRQTPIVFLTATVPHGNAQGHDNAHASVFISKPASIDEVIEGIEENLMHETQGPWTQGPEFPSTPPWTRQASGLPAPEQEFSSCNH